MEVRRRDRQNQNPTVIVAIHGNKQSAALHQSELRTMVQNADFIALDAYVDERFIFKSHRPSISCLQISSLMKICVRGINCSPQSSGGIAACRVRMPHSSSWGVVLQTQSIAFLTSTVSLLVLRSCVLCGIKYQHLRGQCFALNFRFDTLTTFSPQLLLVLCCPLSPTHNSCRSITQSS